MNQNLLTILYPEESINVTTEKSLFNLFWENNQILCYIILLKKTSDVQLCGNQDESFMI